MRISSFFVLLQPKLAILMQSTHPLHLLGQQIEKAGLVVMDNITALPDERETYISPFSSIALCVQGYLKAEYDMRKVEFHAHDITMMPAGHMVRTIEVSPDYQARMVVVSNSFFKRFREDNSFRFDVQNTYYISHPWGHLNDEQFEQVNRMFDVLKYISQHDFHFREEMLVKAQHILTMMIYEYHPINQDLQSNSNYRLFLRFQQAVIDHYKESHEVAFYASMFCLSPKYFSTLIRRESGVTAGEWIDRYLTLQAKHQLEHHSAFNVQQIGYELGFKESAAFCRFFKQQTGLTPGGYRAEMLQRTQHQGVDIR